MSYSKPFHRNYRPLIEGPNSGYSSWAYIPDHEYSQNPTQYTRAFYMIQKDLQDLFEFVEPADINLETYSHRIQQLLVRTCIEIEANFKAILFENKYSKKDNLNRNDYKLINITHHLSGYKVHFPYWDGNQNSFSPFSNWSDPNGKLEWYDAYNSSKHDRGNNFGQANMKHLLNAVAALEILLAAQFGSYGFDPGPTLLSINPGSNYFGNNFGIGNFLLLEKPKDWKKEELYDFDWSTLKNKEDRFDKIDYDEILAEIKQNNLTNKSR